ncbi:hypothetical protein Leryth_018728 [Lithospermum erythrorhizon]|nr:hypothetical protein Leryth_018728 [Lithospermum erythrorhizon]
MHLDIPILQKNATLELNLCHNGRKKSNSAEKLEFGAAFVPFLPKNAWPCWEKNEAPVHFVPKMQKSAEKDLPCQLDLRKAQKREISLPIRYKLRLQTIQFSIL